VVTVRITETQTRSRRREFVGPLDVVGTECRPPDPRAYQGEQRRDHHGAHHEGVQQDAQADDDAQLGQRNQR
jgi:hypothetical protein